MGKRKESGVWGKERKVEKWGIAWKEEYGKKKGKWKKRELYGKYVIGVKKRKGNKGD